MKILLVITTGRSVFKETLDMLADNINLFSHFTNHQIDLCVSYDSKFKGLTKKDFLYETTKSHLFREIFYIGPEDVDKYQKLLTQLSVQPSVIAAFVEITGYGNKRNLILIEAMQKKYDVVIFWDDDEYPVACLQSPSVLVWKETDIIGQHLDALSTGADISTGFLTGYKITVPKQMNTFLESKTSRLLESALGIGNDVVKKGTFLHSENSIKIPIEIPKPHEMMATAGGNWLGGGNSALRGKSIRD